MCGEFASATLVWVYAFKARFAVATEGFVLVVLRYSAEAEVFDAVVVCIFVFMV
jgi:hypothetical protein